MDFIELGQNIRKKRTELGWTQEALAKECEVSTSFIGHIERSSRKASLDTLVSIANALDVSVDYLLGTNINVTVIGPLSDEMPKPKRKALKTILAAMLDNIPRWRRTGA